MAKRGITDVRRQRARQLRRRPTLAESRLWDGLRQLRRLGLAHFRRQAPIGPYVVDFVDLSRRLIVEADGGQHAGAVDAERDAWLAAEGYTILRFWNPDILGDADGVLASIKSALQAAPPTLTLPPRGRESRRDEPVGSPLTTQQDVGDDRLRGSPPPRGEGMGVGQRLSRPRRGGP